MSGYSTFSVLDATDGKKYPLQVLGQVPTDIVNNIPATTVVYRSKCVHLADCMKIIDDQSVTIYAQKKQQAPSFSLPFIGSTSLWPGASHRREQGGVL